MRSQDYEYKYNVEKVFGLNGEERKTLEEVGKLLGLTKGGVYQIEKGAFEKLKKTHIKRRLIDGR